ncbi:MAG: 50S ribosomal protein L4 [Actinomycetota bacterium]|nr:50S ribosomal protein L4 [Actinomycetota bacterium]
MAGVKLLTAAGKSSGSVDLDDAVFGIQPNVPVMHQVVTAQLARRRAGTQSTKTRSEVRGGGAKPYRQKGTGNARQGSIRAPHYTGGGIALGPKPRSYAQKTPKKMIRLALRSALSDRASENKVLVVDSWNFDAPKTKDAVKALEAIGATAGRVLVVLDTDDATAARSFRNLPHVQLIRAAELNAYDVLCNEWIVFTKSTLPTNDTQEAQSFGPRDVEHPTSGDERSASDEEQPSERSERGQADGAVNPPEDGSIPEGFEIKGNADSMKYHTTDSPYYDATNADVFFDTAEHAEAAGFESPASMPNASDEEEGL